MSRRRMHTSESSVAGAHTKTTKYIACHLLSWARTRIDGRDAPAAERLQVVPQARDAEVLLEQLAHFHSWSSTYTFFVSSKKCLKK